MEPVRPDFDWYSEISARKGVSPRCPFATIHRCPRYYSSLWLIGRYGGATQIDPSQSVAAERRWRNSDVDAVTREQEPSVVGRENDPSILSHFCPETIYDRFGWFADYLARYTDEIDADHAHARLGRSNVKGDDWRWAWQSLHPLHYTECSLYSLLLNRTPLTDGPRDTGTQLAARQPVGSPYGFGEHDWLIVEERRKRPDVIYVVLGYQFKSKHHDRNQLEKNVKAMFEQAVNSYNVTATEKVALDFRALAAGYGEHLFNDIARDILSADIAVFETSDLNPNVSLELGVALTWGVSVFPIKKKGRRKPPSDISGQTWADYLESGSQFVDSGHAVKLVELVRRAVRKKLQQVT